MLPGFEDITQDITPDEIILAKWIAKGLALRVGKDNAITNKEIRKVMEEKHYVKINDIRMRRMIQYIRIENLVPCLCAGKKGYYRANPITTEWEDWVESMERRKRQIEYTLACAKLHNNVRS